MLISLIRPWQWAHRVPMVLAEEGKGLVKLLSSHRRTLWATTWVEFHRRYAGNVLGILWSPLYALLFLAMYGFVFLWIQPVSSGKNLTHYETVISIFCGLIPYLGFTEALTTGTGSIKANIALLKNTIYPPELIPVKFMLVSLMSLFISLAILIVMILPTRLLGWHLLYLPVAFLLLMLVSLAAVWLFSALAALLPDINQLVNLLALMLLFISPIGYTLDAVHGIPRLIALANPLTHLIESFRYALIGMRDTPMWTDAVVGVVALAAAWGCGIIFMRLKPLFADFE
jgi:lipopolysaccharide transport system permease protein